MTTKKDKPEPKYAFDKNDYLVEITEETSNNRSKKKVKGWKKKE